MNLIGVKSRYLVPNLVRGGRTLQVLLKPESLCYRVLEQFFLISAIFYICTVPLGV